MDQVIQGLFCDILLPWLPLALFESFSHSPGDGGQLDFFLLFRESLYGLGSAVLYFLGAWWQRRVLSHSDNTYNDKGINILFWVDSAVR